MFRKTFLALAFCSLPVMADSIHFTGNSQYFTQKFGTQDVAANGVNSLHYSAAVPTAWYADQDQAKVSTDVDITQANGVYDVTGSLLAFQGWMASPSDRGWTGASLQILLDLPAASGNWALSGKDIESNDDGYGTGNSTCTLSITGGTGQGTCQSVNVNETILHTPGDPLTLRMNWGNFVASPASTYREQFSFSLVDPDAPAETPEPSTFALLGLPLVLLTTLRRRLALS